jgi:hypothetical protein
MVKIIVMALVILVAFGGSWACSTYNTTDYRGFGTRERNRKPDRKYDRSWLWKYLWSMVYTIDYDSSK